VTLEWNWEELVPSLCSETYGENWFHRCMICIHSALKIIINPLKRSGYHMNRLFGIKIFCPLNSISVLLVFLRRYGDCCG
jgi:hypothetical protein